MFYKRLRRVSNHCNNSCHCGSHADLNISFLSAVDNPTLSLSATLSCENCIVNEKNLRQIISRSNYHIDICSLPWTISDYLRLVEIIGLLETFLRIRKKLILTCQLANCHYSTKSLFHQIY